MRRIPPLTNLKPIRRGSSPSLLFHTPYRASLIEDGYLTFSQRGAVVLEKRFTDGSISVLDGALVVDLTQEETLQLTEVDTCLIQARYILQYGKTAGSGVWEVPILGVLKGGEI